MKPALFIALLAVCGTALAEFEVEVIKDVVYGSGPSRSADGTTMPFALKLDAYLPKNCPDMKKPVLLCIHGGGFRGGSKNTPHIVQFAQYFAQRGYASFSIDYRMMDQDPPAPQEFHGGNKQKAAAHAAFVDTKTAVRWIRANKEKYGIDPDRIAAMGGSAGAITSLALAFTDDKSFVTDIPGQTIAKENHPEILSRIQACVSCWGSVTMFNDALSKSAPPVLLFHGVDDKNVNTPASGSMDVHKRLKALGVPAELRLLPGFGHGAWKATVDGRALYEVAFDFVQREMMKKGPIAGATLKPGQAAK
jgi:para-nitrobenzyl esterase